MAKRTTQTVVRFTSAFLLPGFDKPQRAGDYRVDHDEEPIEGIEPVNTASGSEGATLIERTFGRG